MIRKLTLALGAATILLPGLSQAAIVNFEDLTNTSSDGFTLYGGSLNSGGYHFESLVHGSDNRALAAWNGGEPNYYTGSNAIFLNFNDDRVRMMRQDNLAFNVASIDLADFERRQQATVVTFIGTHTNGSTTTEAVTLSDSTSMATFALAGMTNLSKLEWDGGAFPTVNPQTQFDNIVTTPVPEPATLATLAAGGALIIRRRRGA